MRVRFEKKAIIALLALAWMMPRAVFAGDESESRRYVNAVIRSYRRLDYEQALQQVLLARREPRSTGEEVTLALYEGLILYEIGDRMEGGRALRYALFLRSDAKLPEKVAPKVEMYFEEIRKKVIHEKSLLASSVAPEREAPPSPQQPEAVLGSSASPAEETRAPETRSKIDSTRDALIARLVQLKGKLLKANHSSGNIALRDLVGLARQLRVADSDEVLQEAARVIEAWEQQY